MTTQVEITMAPEILMVGITVVRVMATRERELELERVEAVKSLLFSEGFLARWCVTPVEESPGSMLKSCNL